MDAGSFDELYAASFRRLTHQLYAMVGDREEAQDCVQEAFVRAWAHRRQLDQAEHPEAWVRTTAYRLAVSRWRRMVRARRPPDRAVGSQTETPAPASSTEAHVVLVAALRRLPADQRRALVLHHIADLPIAQVAAETGVAEGTVKARLSRGRTALAELLGDPVEPHPSDRDRSDRNPSDLPGGVRHA